MSFKLNIEKLHSAPDKRKLNEEWITISNIGETPFNAEGCSISVARGAGARPKLVTTLKAGLIVKPGEKVRLISGSAGKKSQGDVPAEEDGLRNFYLWLKVPYLDKPGTFVKLSHGQHPLCSAVFAPN